MGYMPAARVVGIKRDVNEFARNVNENKHVYEYKDPETPRRPAPHPRPAGAVGFHGFGCVTSGHHHPAGQRGADGGPGGQLERHQLGHHTLLLSMVQGRRAAGGPDQQHGELCVVPVHQQRELPGGSDQCLGAGDQPARLVKRAQCAAPSLGCQRPRPVGQRDHCGYQPARECGQQRGGGGGGIQSLPIGEGGQHVVGNGQQRLRPVGQRDHCGYQPARECGQQRGGGGGGKLSHFVFESGRHVVGHGHQRQRPVGHRDHREHQPARLCDEQRGGGGGGRLSFSVGEGGRHVVGDGLQLLRPVGQRGQRRHLPARLCDEQRGGGGGGTTSLPVCEGGWHVVGDGP